MVKAPMFYDADAGLCALTRGWEPLGKRRGKEGLPGRGSLGADGACCAIFPGVMGGLRGLCAMVKADVPRRAGRARLSPRQRTSPPYGGKGRSLA